MLLNRRLTDATQLPPWCTVGARIRAEPPTVSLPIAGIVSAIERTTVTVRTRTGVLIAVDVEDCQPALAS